MDRDEDGVKQELQEKLLGVKAHAVVDPGAVMILTGNVLVTYVAMKALWHNYCGTPLAPF